jgi:hypothetical protein
MSREILFTPRFNLSVEAGVTVWKAMDIQDWGARFALAASQREKPLSALRAEVEILVRPVHRFGRHKEIFWDCRG